VLNFFCRKLGYSGGYVSPGRPSERYDDRVTLPKDAIRIGACNYGDSWPNCSGGGNDKIIGGKYPNQFAAAGCDKGHRAGVKVKCTGTPRYKRASAPAYLEVPGYELCLEESSAPGSTSSSYCLPPSKPEYCSDASWKELQNVWTGNGPDCAPPLINEKCFKDYDTGLDQERCLPEIKPANCEEEEYEELLNSGDWPDCPSDQEPPLIGGISGLAPKYQDCFKDYGIGPDSDRCLPERKLENCGEEEYEELLTQILTNQF